jgi:hypothetical protein
MKFTSSTGIVFEADDTVAVAVGPRQCADARRVSSVSTWSDASAGNLQLANGPAPGECVKAAATEADISERNLIAAAERLGVRSQRGQWWLPGQDCTRGIGSLCCRFATRHDRHQEVGNLTQMIGVEPPDKTRDRLSAHCEQIGDRAVEFFCFRPHCLGAQLLLLVRCCWGRHVGRRAVKDSLNIVVAALTLIVIPVTDGRAILAFAVIVLMRNVRNDRLGGFLIVWLEA